MKFSSTGFDVQVSGPNFVFTMTFDLVDETIPATVATTSFTFNIHGSRTTAQIKTDIANCCRTFLQAFYNDWKNRNTKINDFYTTNKAALESYLNSNIVF